MINLNMKNENGSVICRLCLEVAPVGYTLLQENILSIVKIITPIEVSENDNLPNTSCSKCIFNLYFVENVRNRIIESEKKLLSLYHKDGNFSALLKTTEESVESLNTHTSDHKTFPIQNDHLSNSLEIFESNVDPFINTEELDDNDGNSDSLPNDSISTDSENEDESIKSIIYRKNQEKPYLYHCNVCNVDFYGMKLYAVHRGKHFKKSCNVCGVTVRGDYFKKHLLIHKLGAQVCDICGSTHKSWDGLRNHRYHFHNTKKKNFTCKECGESFKYSHRLTHHTRKVHTGEKPHVCDSCGKSFFDLATMKKHIKLIHLKLREYPCKYCKKEFTSSYALKVHTRQHTEEAPYICELCSEAFRQKVSLKTHLKSKHDIVLSTTIPSSSQTKPDVIEEYKDENIIIEFSTSTLETQVE